MFSDTLNTIVIDGLILNQKELFEKHQTTDFECLVQKMHELNPKDFFMDFRGPFTGLFYDKNQDAAVVFTNQTGDSAVFHYEDSEINAFSSNFQLLTQFLKENHIKMTFSSKAAHWMLTFGYLIGKETFVEEIKRLNAGKALYLVNGKWTEEVYHRFHSKNIQISEDEAIETIDQLFRQAVKRCFDKDLEYGYTQHLADMSAGMDSRMTNSVAKSLGYQNITNICYSQLGSEEEKLSKKASAIFGNKMIFEKLDDHEFIFDIERLTAENFGTYLYTGITGGRQLLSQIDFNAYGTEQTGQLGDIAIGTFVKGKNHEVNPDELRLSHLLPLNPKYDVNEDKFENQDLYSLYLRGFQGAMSSWFVRKNFTFALSPFTDVDFMSFCYALPIAMRQNHNLYWKWVKTYYPEALQVKTSRKHIPTSVIAKSTDFAKRASKKAFKIAHKALFQMGLAKSRISPASSMNPYDYWYDTDPKMRTFLENYFKENSSLISSDAQLTADVSKMFESKNMLDKLMALTVLAARKVFL
jgi:hypothetical protein